MWQSQQIKHRLSSHKFIISVYMHKFKDLFSHFYCIMTNLYFLLEMPPRITQLVFPFVQIAWKPISLFMLNADCRHQKNLQSEHA